MIGSHSSDASRRRRLKVSRISAGKVTFMIMRASTSASRSLRMRKLV